ncbi:MAG: bifunctional 5,10-methylene-tetrahydrofolate dehydrogenase/5,10-methylene-tetrahydrofolate cyclohydrolase [Treponema sp.]|jgi:methylenetetrahydrofolate dehydrogenase (NADP+)/methenyltetrahydrofolate cyclohydrolase|nr:bifunctional 5,10-methylene-tetrahydrofolate dehydrogenase/5,10-methylene-tetrahydrofolate cyclohydrolase [Treponema sp.]
MAVIIDGKTVAGELRERVKARSVALRDKGIVPCLAVILVGEDPASLSYVTAKEKALGEAEMGSRDLRLPHETTQEELLVLIAKLNGDPLVHGILVQLPLPSHISEERVITAIDPAKDVDGFHPVSVGNMVLGRPGFLPCTPHGVVVLLRELAIPLSGAHAVVLGRSNIVGKPLANLLARRDINATVTICHTGTRDLAAITRQADILIAAAGKPGLVTADMVKEGAAVIEVGVNRVPDPSAKKGYRLRGDVDFEAVAEKAGFITPVPGGVGPMTIAMLLQNVVQAAEQGRMTGRAKVWLS